MKLLRLLCLLLLALPAPAASPTRVLIVVGPSTHPPGSHEVAAGGRVMLHCLEHLGEAASGLAQAPCPGTLQLRRKANAYQSLHHRVSSCNTWSQ